MRVVLVDPAPRYGIKEPYESLGIAYIASTLKREGHEVNLISSALEYLSPRGMVRAIIQAEPELVGFSVMEIDARRTLAIVDALRHRGIQAHITLGGHFPTFNHTRILRGFDGVDSIVRGEGEYTLSELAQQLSDGGSLKDVRGLSYRDGPEIRVNPPRPLIQDLDALPFPDRYLTELVLRAAPVMSMSASRGCYGNCSFCSIRSFYEDSPGPKWRTRSPEGIADEMEALVRRFGRQPIRFVDDQFVGPGKKGRSTAYRLGEEILSRNIGVQFTCSCRVDDIEEDLFGLLKEAGLKKVFIGVESGTERGLTTFNKRTTVAQNKKALATLDKVGIEYKIGFIFFDPYTTYEEVQQNLRFLSEISPFWQGKKGVLSITPSLIVHGGTPIHARLQRERRLIGNYLRYGYHIEDRKAKIAQFVAELVLKWGLVYTHASMFWWKRQWSRAKGVLSGFLSRPRAVLKGMIRSARPIPIHPPN